MAAVCDDGLVITTGLTPQRRSQHWVRLAEPCDDDLEFQAAFGALVEHTGADQKVKDAARVMRLGGTVSFPSAKKVAKGYCDELTTVTIKPEAAPSAIEALQRLAPGERISERRADHSNRPQGDGIVRGGGALGQLVTDGREKLFRNLLVEQIRTYQQVNGCDPTAADLWDGAFGRFQAEADNTDASWTDGHGQAQLRARVARTLARLRSGALARVGLYSIDTEAGRAEAQAAQGGRDETWRARTAPRTDTASGAAPGDRLGGRAGNGGGDGDEPGRGAGAPKPPERPALDIFDWRSSRFVGEPPPIRYLVTDAVPVAVPGLLVSQGDTGKSMIGAELCRRVAFGSSGYETPILGGQVAREGTAVFITAEDDAATLHRRLAALDPGNYRHMARGERLIVVPLPNAGGSLPLFRQTRDGMEETDHFRRLRDQLLSIQDLALVVIDPLQAFVMGPINEDPAAGQFVCTQTGALATETGAAIFYAHHMRKSQKPITTLQDAREAVRGTTALVDGVRVAFALWPVEDDKAKAVCKELGRPFEHNAIVQGGVIKANGPARRVIRTYARNSNGLLVDVNDRLVRSAVDQEDKLDSLVEAVRAAARLGSPFTKSGVNGVFEQRARLPQGMHGVGKHTLQGMVDEALNRKLIVQALAAGSGKSFKWLDVPNGPFALGYGEFTPGAAIAEATAGGAA